VTERIQQPQRKLQAMNFFFYLESHEGYYPTTSTPLLTTKTPAHALGFFFAIKRILLKIKAIRKQNLMAIVELTRVFVTSPAAFC